MNNTADWETLFDLAQHSGHDLPWLALGAVLLLLALAALWRARRRGAPQVLPGFLVLMALVALGATALGLWDQQRLLAALQAGQTQVVQGSVQSHSVQQTASWNGNAKRYDRRTWEAFLVGEVAFGFDRNTAMAGFTNGGSTLVALADGERLRIHFVEDNPGDYASRRILRLERQRIKPDSALAQRGERLHAAQPAAPQALAVVAPRGAP